MSTWWLKLYSNLDLRRSGGNEMIRMEDGQAIRHVKRPEVFFKKHGASRVDEMNQMGEPNQGTDKIPECLEPQAVELSASTGNGWLYNEHDREQVYMPDVDRLYYRTVSNTLPRLVSGMLTCQKFGRLSSLVWVKPANLVGWVIRRGLQVLSDSMVWPWTAGVCIVVDVIREKLIGLYIRIVGKRQRTNLVRQVRTPNNSQILDCTNWTWIGWTD